MDSAGETHIPLQQRPSPLDAVVAYLPQWLQPFLQLVQPHVDSVLRLAVAILDDIARQLAPFLHTAVDAAAPYLQVRANQQLCSEMQ